MRRMYSENQVIELVKQAFEEGKLSGGTKLYKHDITVDASHSAIIISTIKEPITNAEELDNLVGNSLSPFVQTVNSGEIVGLDYENSMFIYITLFNLEVDSTYDYTAGELYTDTVTQL